MYSKIEIFDTEYLEKYLLISSNNSLYVGVIIRDITSFLKNGLTLEMIEKKINDKYNIQLSNQEVSEIKASIDIFISKKETTNLYKVAIISNPSKIIIPKIILDVFFEICFYPLFSFFLIINCFTYVKISTQNNINSFNDNIIIAGTLFVILFFHELGHSLSAKKFNINVKEIGFGFYYIFPVLYVNLKESWKLKKKKRIVINLSGIYFQLIIGFFLSVFVLFYEQNTLSSSILKMNLSIILLNLNPFLKFDGYWILSDLLEETNLLKTSNSLIKEKFKLKTKNKFSNWIIIYTILRLVFITYVVQLAIYAIINIYKKCIDNSQLNLTDNLFLLILSLYIIKIFIRKLKKIK